MFLETRRRGYTKDGQQFAQGLFLVLFDEGHLLNKPERDGLPCTCDYGTKYKHERLRAAVRFVRYRQCGHFMMGSARFGKERISLSGPYGGDGLPRECPAGLWDKLVPLPDELIRSFWHGEGRDALSTWAHDNLDALRKAGR